VIALVGVAIALLLPAVQAVREESACVKCQNNLRQLGIAFHHANDARGKLPPGVGFYPQEETTAYGTGFFHLLPYFEQGNLYEQSQVNGCYYAKNNGVYQQKVSLLVCPSDPTANGGQVTNNLGETWGGSSYAGNAQVFCEVDHDSMLKNPQGTPRIPQSFPDGTSNTILLAEKYARCTDATYSEGGSFWAYDNTGSTVQPLHPGFAVSWASGSIGPDSRFQVRPRPDNCDPTRTSTPHRTMNVALADGSVRRLSADLSGATWWAACTPAGGETLGTDW
jgi:hypothetical protein